MDRYTARINLHGSTQRERLLNRTKDSLQSKLPSSLSCKTVKLNGIDASIVINSGTKSYYKEFTSFQNQKIITGDYIEWANNTWLIYEADSDDEIYIQGKMYQCNYVLYWQDKLGELISRPCHIVNASAYNNGESGNKTITLATNQYMVYMPIDKESMSLSNGKRMFIDYHLSNPSVYELTRPDVVSMKFGEKGITYFIFTQTETKATDSDKLITLDSGEQVWIADYISPTTPSQPPNESTVSSTITSVITGNTNLKIGYPRIYTVSFLDEDGEITTNVDYTWNIANDFSDRVSKIIDGDTIKLQVDDEELIDSSILLQVIINESINSEIKINISGMF